MSNNFEENNKFFNTDGTINRRTFITNLLITEIFEALVYSTPMLILLIINPDITGSIMKSAIQTGMFPRWLAIYCFVVWIMKIGLLYPSIVKRIRDITGNYDNTNWVFAVLAFSVMAFLPAPPAIRQILSSVPLVIAICLMVLKGRISGERPKSEIFKFNWGAMFGTWIWGLINKSYITLLSIPLFFTTGFIPFMIICGIKGNEWAYKNSEKTLEDFHKSQSKQAAAFSAIIPVIFILFLFFGSITGLIAFGKYLKKNPEALKKLENYSQELIKSSTETRFSKIKFTENEYQFYMNPVEWSKLPQYGKLNTFHIAENYVILSVFKENKDIKDLITYAKEYRKIKIYSTFNNEILAEFHFNEQKIKDLTEKYKKREISAKEYWKSINQGYKFNEHPTLP